MDLDLRLGAPATDVDQVRQTMTVADGDSVQYDQLVIATSVRPRRMPGTTNLAGTELSLTDGVVCEQYCAATPVVHDDSDVALEQPIPRQVDAHRTSDTSG
ncbi:hypothetical protein [Rhodococcus sp. SJ-3]|uniref:hypothetical protein n=1 Tax=Rhodococcus sp. SJ-3 TaxID=3454628 RepID=UPI003F7A28F3